MVYDLALLILGDLPVEFTFLYGMLAFILAVVAVILLSSPIILVIKLVGGK